jgi:hypothetical protein
LKLTNNGMLALNDERNTGDVMLLAEAIFFCVCGCFEFAFLYSFDCSFQSKQVLGIRFHFNLLFSFVSGKVFPFSLIYFLFFNTKDIQTLTTFDLAFQPKIIWKQFLFEQRNVTINGQFETRTKKCNIQ